MRREVPGGSLLVGLLLAVLSAGCDGSAHGASRPRAPAPHAQPGDMALDYVTGGTYHSLVIEVDYVKGAKPSEDALRRMREIFLLRLDKPGGVEYVLDTEVPPEQARARWQIGDILVLEAQHRRNFTGDAANRNTAVIWVVYLNGASEFDEKGSRALGLSYDASSVAIFSENIAASTLPEVRDVVEAMVLVHEGGHLFGLVNNGLPMVNNHEDPANPRHDISDRCVMHHRIETSNLDRETAPMDYDYECRLDMFHAGGVAPGPRESPQSPATAVPPPSIPRRPSGPLLGTADGLECRSR